MTECTDCKEKDLKIKLLEIKVKAMTDLLDNLRSFVGANSGESIFSSINRFKTDIVVKEPEKEILPVVKRSSRVISRDDRKFLIKLATELGLDFNDHSSYRILMYLEYQIKYVLPKQGKFLSSADMDRINELYKIVTSNEIVFEE